MNSKPFVPWLSLLLVVASTNLCFGQTMSQKPGMTDAQIRVLVAEAHSKDRRLIIKLKKGGTISGIVSPLSDSSFRLTHSHGSLGEGDSVTIDFADVESVKGRNPIVKTLKNIGTVSALSAGVAVGVAVLLPICLPILAALEGLSYLLHGEGLPSCSIGN